MIRLLTFNIHENAREAPSYTGNFASSRLIGQLTLADILIKTTEQLKTAFSQCHTLGDYVNEWMKILSWYPHLES